jgi:glutamate synthase domain-containing protein 3
VRIVAGKRGYRELNEKIHRVIARGIRSLVLDDVNGQRYICAGVKAGISVRINGTPGNDLGAFMDGPRIEIYGNGQDGIANTMNRGRIVIHGHAGDVLAYGMRGGEVYIRDEVGYRVGIHMKAFRTLMPVLVVGGGARDYLGEYMAGGVIIVLNRGGDGEPAAGFGVGSGAHGGEIFVRGTLAEERLGKELRRVKLTSEDRALLKKYISEYCRYFNVNDASLLKARFSKYVPLSHRPYGKLYAY